MTPREFWQPAIAAHFGYKDWEMDGLYTYEYVAMMRGLQSLAAEAPKAAD